MRGGPFVDVEELQVPSARACELVRSQLMVPAIRNVVNPDKLLTGEHEITMSEGVGEWESWQLEEKAHMLHDLHEVAAVLALKVA